MPSGLSLRWATVVRNKACVRCIAVIAVAKRVALSLKAGSRVGAVRFSPFSFALQQRAAMTGGGWASARATLLLLSPAFR
jgi:hypothetical protein